MSKQDRQGVRKASDLEQKYSFGKSFAEAFGIAEAAQRTAEEAKKAVEAIDENLTPDEIFNRLTDDGNRQGIYKDNETNNYYINATYISTGVLASKDGGVKIDMDKGVGNLARGQAAHITGWDYETSGFTKDIDDAIREFLTAELDNMQEDTIKDFAIKVGMVNTTSHPPGAELALQKLRNPAGHLQASASFEWVDGTISHMTAIEDSATGMWAWDEMAWDNPPMMPNVEYRTTKRYNGKPVYVLRITKDSLPNNATWEFGSHYAGKEDNIISLVGKAWVANDWNPFPVYMAYGLAANMWCGATKVYVRTYGDMSQYKAEAIIEYIK